MSIVEIVGVTVAGLAILLIVILSIVVFLLYRKVKRLEKRLNAVSGKRQETVVELSPVRKQTIPTPQLSRPVKTIPSYENAEVSLELSAVALPRKVTGERSGNYTDVPDTLPPFLMNEEMLMLPKVGDNVVETAQKEFDESYARLSMIKINQNGDDLQADYVDPQDARFNNTHDKLNQRMSKSKQGSDEASPSSTSSRKVLIPMANREDYTIVSDALPDGSVAIVGAGTSDGDVLRPRTSSDISPTKKVTTNLKRKSESMKRPEPLSQPLHRRSTAAKEMVTFDPKAGFKLSAKRTASDGTPCVTKPKETTESNSAPQSPSEEKKPPLQPDVGGKHVYAAVDLTAKCRPESDMIRREGVGTPDHYVACM